MNTPPDPVERARLAFEKNGFTASVYFPPEANWEQVQSFFDRISILADQGYFASREGWDPFVVGHTRDILGVDHTSGHIYLSTGCLHGNHGYCKGEGGFSGPKTPAICKFCAAPCICVCHTEKDSDIVDG